MNFLFLNMLNKYVIINWYFDFMILSKDIYKNKFVVRNNYIEYV